MSSGEVLFAVPNVVGSDRATAESALKSAGFKVEVADQYSDTIEKDKVISQSETAGTNIKKNSTVLIVVSKGMQTVTVPNVVGKDSSSAQKAMTDAGLSVSIQEQASDTVAAGKVISQSTAAGSSVKPGTPVTLIVSTGMPKVTVPNVVGSDRATAEKALSDNGLTSSVSEQYSDTVAAGIVISQTIAAGSSVNKGSRVEIVVSRGPENAGVPNVVGSDRSSAISALEAAGFKVSEGTPQYSDTVAEGIVISQDVAGGSQVKKGTTVTIIVSRGQEMVTVPSVVGMTYAQAESQLSQQGLKATRGSEEYSADVPAGSVISQSIAAGSNTAKNSTVTLVISKGQELVELPDVTGMAASSAESKLSQSGFAVSRGSEEYSDTVQEGCVIRQSESAGSKLAKGSTVTIIVSKGVQPFTISFNSDGGTSVGSVTMKKGDTLSSGSLPVPTMDYYNFSGWTYNGAGVDGMTVSGDITLTATWSKKAASDWVVAGNVPAGANVVDNKWTYTVTTTETTWSRETALDGYSRTGNEKWEMTAQGSRDWATWIGDFGNETSNLNYGQPYVAEETDTFKRDVENVSAGYYVYWHYTYPVAGQSNETHLFNRDISQYYGTWLSGRGSCTLYREFASSYLYPNRHGDAVCVGEGRGDAPIDYQCCVFWCEAVQRCNYTEYVKNFEYTKTKVESRESTTGEPSGNGVGNIQHLVRYIPK